MKVPVKALVVVTLLCLFPVFSVWTALSSRAEGPVPYHKNQYLVCYDCHTMHSSDTLGFSEENAYGDGRNFYNSAIEGEPSTKLLKGQTINIVCLGCHDGQTFAPDVYGIHSNNYNREAGALNDANNELDGIYQEFMGHSLGSLKDPPGYSGVWSYEDPVQGLTCIECHAQHGKDALNGRFAYRNLPSNRVSTDPANSPVFTVSTVWDDTVDVQINVNSYTPGQGDITDSKYYSYGNVIFHRSRDSGYLGGTNNDAPVNGSNRIVGGVCGVCHSLFHGSVGGTEIGGASTGGTSAMSGFIRHPSSYAVLGDGMNGATNILMFLQNTYKVPVLVANEDLTDAGPFCLSCHKAHGNANPFGLFLLDQQFAPGASVPEGLGPEEGSNYSELASGLRNLCGQCHPTAR